MDTYSEELKDQKLDGVDRMLTVYRQFVKNIPKPMAKAFIDAEASARTSKAGLWAAKDPIPPWEWRREQRKK